MTINKLRKSIQTISTKIEAIMDNLDSISEEFEDDGISERIEAINDILGLLIEGDTKSLPEIIDYIENELIITDSEEE